MKTIPSIFICVVLILIGCQGESVYSPKPRMYPKIDFPERSYTSFNKPYCSLSFQVATYARIIQDSLFFNQKPLDPCWFDIDFPILNGRLHCSYYPVTSNNSFDKLVSDAFTFVEKHDIKANYRQESMIQNVHGNSGILFELDGPVATPIQFFLSDSSRHFFRASLYFNNKVNPDSMQIVHEFIKEDILTMIESFQFSN